MLKELNAVPKTAGELRTEVWGGKRRESLQKGTADSPVFFVSLQTSPIVILPRRRRRREMVSTPSLGSCARDALESKWLEPLVLPAADAGCAPDPVIYFAADWRLSVPGAVLQLTRALSPALGMQGCPPE